MRREIVPVVEGAGDAAAVVALLDRILGSLPDRADLVVGDPIQAKGRGNLTKPGGLEHFLEVARWRRPAGTLILVDADKDCARDLASSLSARVDRADSRGSVVVVCPVRRFEYWLRAGLDDESRSADFDLLGNPEAWIEARSLGGQSYKRPLHQARLTRAIDLDLAARCRSFRRLLHAVEQVIAADAQGLAVITP